MVHITGALKSRITINVEWPSFTLPLNLQDLHGKFQQLHKGGNEVIKMATCPRHLHIQARQSMGELAQPSPWYSQE